MMQAFPLRRAARFGLVVGAVLSAPVAMAQAAGVAPSSEPPSTDLRPAESGQPAQEVQARCRPLSGDFRAACQARISGAAAGPGTASGAPPRVQIVVRPPGSDGTPTEPQTKDIVVPAPAR